MTATRRCGDDFFQTSTNPAAIFIFAHLKTLETQKNIDLRAEEKVKLFERMAELELNRDQFYKLLRLVSGLMKLPELHFYT